MRHCAEKLLTTRQAGSLVVRLCGLFVLVLTVGAVRAEPQFATDSMSDNELRLRINAVGGLFAAGVLAVFWQLDHWPVLFFGWASGLAALTALRLWRGSRSKKKAS